MGIAKEKSITDEKEKASTDEKEKSITESEKEKSITESEKEKSMTESEKEKSITESEKEVEEAEDEVPPPPEELRFYDFGAAPGGFCSHLLEQPDFRHGYGISLPAEDGGYHMCIKHESRL